MERITIVGMGPVGASIGLGLKRAKLRNTEIVGTSRSRNALSAVSKMGAADQTTSNLRSAVDGAQLVILDLPVTEMREILEAIGPVLDDGCVVTDTGTTKVRVMEWADQNLPPAVNFVGGHPLLKKQLRSLDDAAPTAFENGDYCVIPAKSADRDSVRTVVGLVEALRANPLFLDPHEHDSYAAAMTHLPTVLSAAFVTATTGSDAWRDMHRLAASDFGDFSSLASNDPEDNEAACLANPDALVHWLDQMITELYSYRNQIKDRSDKLLESFVKAWEAEARWQVGAVVADNRERIPSAADSMATIFVGERLMDRYRQMTGKGKKDSRRKYSRGK